MQCYKVANLQHLIVAECYTSLFQDDLILHNSAYYLLHIKCSINAAHAVQVSLIAAK